MNVKDFEGLSANNWNDIQHKRPIVIVCVRDPDIAQCILISKESLFTNNVHPTQAILFQNCIQHNYLKID